MSHAGTLNLPFSKPTSRQKMGKLPARGWESALLSLCHTAAGQLLAWRTSTRRWVPSRPVSERFSQKARGGSSSPQ